MNFDEPFAIKFRNFRPRDFAYARRERESKHARRAPDESRLAERGGVIKKGNAKSRKKFRVDGNYCALIAKCFRLHRSILVQKFFKHFFNAHFVFIFGTCRRRIECLGIHLRRFQLSTSPSLGYIKPEKFNRKNAFLSEAESLFIVSRE